MREFVPPTNGGTLARQAMFWIYRNTAFIMRLLLFLFVTRRQLYQRKEPLTITACLSFQSSREDMTSFGYGDLLVTAIKILISQLILLFDTYRLLAPQDVLASKSTRSLN